MLCKYCGTALEAQASVCGNCGAAVEAAAEETEALPLPAAEPTVAEETAAAAPEKAGQNRRKPHILLRVALQLLSLILCLALCVSLVATVLLADLNRMLSSGGMKQLVTAILTTNTPPTQPETPEAPDDDLPEGVSEEDISFLIDWIYGKMMEATDNGLSVTKEQLQNFVNEPTISGFMTDKLAGYAEDFLNGTALTTITPDEVMQLLEDNMGLLERTFNKKLNLLQKQLLTATVRQIMQDTDVDALIRDKVFSTVEDSINENTGNTGLTWEKLQPMLQSIGTERTIHAAMGLCVMLMLLLTVLNFYNLPGGLCWSACPCILIGAALTVPLTMLPTLDRMLDSKLLSAAIQVISSFIDVLLPIHSTLLYVGFALLAVCFAWWVIRACLRHKRRLEAA